MLHLTHRFCYTIIMVKKVLVNALLRFARSIRVAAPHSLSGLYGDTSGSEPVTTQRSINVL